MASFLVECSHSGRVSYCISSDAAILKGSGYGSRLGSERVLWRIPDDLDGCTIDEAITAYRMWREYTLGVSD